MEIVFKHMLEYLFLHALCMPLKIKHMLEDITKHQYNVSYVISKDMVVYSIGDICTITFLITPNNYIKEILYV